MTRRRVGPAVAVLLAVALAAACSGWSEPRGTAGRSGGGGAATAEGDRPIERAYGSSAAGRGLAWADEVQREKDRVPLPVGPVAGYGLGDFTSRYTNVRDGERVTRSAPPCDCPTSTVWFVGGSAAFGTGQRDDHTIASELVRLATADGKRLVVHNLAVPGYTLWQEHQAVLARLAAGGPRPDLVLFYDGFNDVVVSLSRTIIDGPGSNLPVVFDATHPFAVPDADKIAAGVAAAGGTEHIGEEIAKRFRALQDLIRASLAAHGIESEFFLQPDATADERQLRAGYQDGGVVSPALLQPFVETAAAAARHHGPEVHDLRQVFADHRRPVFFDIVHTNEEGARIVAEAIYAVVRDDVGRPAG